MAGMCAKESQLPFCTLFRCNYLQLRLFMYDAGDSACDVSRVTTKAPCEAALMGERHVRIEISDFVMRTFALKNSKKNLNWKLKYVKVKTARANSYWN